jgi:hypothetical protein
MNIKSFKEGDVITRAEPVQYGGGHKDSSWCGNKMTLVGIDEKSKTIVLLEDRHDEVVISYARDGWDEGWEYYPQSLLKKAKNYLQKKKA